MMYGKKATGKPAVMGQPADTMKAAPARSNAGGAVKGQARAAAVKAMNATKKPVGMAKGGMAKKGKK